MTSPIKEVIKDRLYISDITGLATLKQNPGIFTHILTLTSEKPTEIPESISQIGCHKFIQIDDVDEERILDKFPEIIEFYKTSKCLLVHCQQGASRSVAAVSCILMEKQEITQQNCFDHLNSIGIETDKMIEGFVNQLKLFEKLNFTVNKSNPEYRLWRFNLLNVGYNSGALVVNDVLWSSVNDKTASNMIYRCSKCRHRLFKKSHILMGDFHHYFLQPLEWMKDVIIDCGQTGKLHCPKCSQKLGHFSWIGEHQKGVDGDWLAPVFNVSVKKVDKINIA